MNNNQNTIAQIESYFVRSVSVILAFTCVAKTASSFGHATVLRIPNEALPLTNAQAMQAAAALECVVLVILAFVGRVETRLAAILWLCSVFAVYRVGAAIMTGSQSTCPCLGSLTEKLHIAHATANAIMAALLSYMFAGALMFLVLRLLSAKRETRAILFRRAAGVRWQNRAQTNERPEFSRV